MFYFLFLLQLEDGIDFLSMYNGGSEDSEMVAKLTGTMNDAKLPMPDNQLFVVFYTSNMTVGKGFHALIEEG